MNDLLSLEKSAITSPFMSYTLVDTDGLYVFKNSKSGKSLEKYQKSENSKNNAKKDIINIKVNNLLKLLIINYL